VITEPGVYEMPDDEYHADPVPAGSLSSSGARQLLACPALFRYEREHPSTPSRTFDFGHAAHLVVLGAGPELHVVDADSYQTKAAREERDQAHARGAVPLLPAEFDAVQAMAAALRAHPRSSELFAEGGLAEQSLFWRDPEMGVWCRARPDWLSHRIVDYKTTTRASLRHISQAVANYGYHIQAAHYLAGAIELDLVAPDAEFLFVFQEKTPPYLATVVELDDDAMKVGYEQWRRALEIYRDCTAADRWPTYSSDIELISLPGWAIRAHESETW
jgi:hypothetical protein